jgi:tryptophanase
MKTIIEQFRIKTVEPIYLTAREQRLDIHYKAYFNPFLVRAEDLIIDLLTDSGTSAMSSALWAAIMIGDESYAGSSSFFRFEKTIREITGIPIVIPTHQGRAAEKIIFSVMGGSGKYILSNTLFDTTRANIEISGAEGIDLLCPEGKIPGKPAPFKGNMDVEALEGCITEKGAGNIPMVIITVTNNSGSGQPVSMENIRSVKAVCKKYSIPLFTDACRFAENCYFIQQREKEFSGIPIPVIARELFSYADGCTMAGEGIYTKPYRLRG